ncbi:MAG: hypothetical protein J0L77_01985 [Alphaproteobacteria bacterium]|nr:hypothetical protein [Alphaproteobacteria bacterium]
MKILSILALLSFFTFTDYAYSNEQFQYDDYTKYLKEFIQNFSSSNQDNRPVYLEKLTVGTWSKMALVFGYADNMSGCEKEMVELMKQKYSRTDYRCVEAS